MSILSCLRGKALSGVAPKAAADALADAIESRMAKRAELIGKAAAEREAAGEFMDGVSAALEREALLRIDTVNAQIAVAQRAADYKARVAELRAQPGLFGLGNKAPVTLQNRASTPLGAAMRSLLARDPWEIGTGDNAHYLARNLRGEAHRLMAEQLTTLRAGRLGFGDTQAAELEVLQALYGKGDVSPEAKALADAWSAKVAPFLFAEHNAVSRGGIAERADWKLPNPAQSREKVAAATVEDYVARTLPRLDRAQMLDYATGKPLTEPQLRELLARVHETVAGRGLSEPAAPGGGRAMLANSRLDHRVLMFKSAEDWTAHAADFGEHASVWGAMTGHINAMANEIAMMRVMGPNPNATRSFIDALFDREARQNFVEAADPANAAAAVRANRRATSSAERARKGFDNLYAQVSGEGSIPVHEGMAQAMGDFRAWLVSTQMGSAIISSITDFGLVSTVARMNDIPAMKVVARYTAGMKNNELEIKAAQAGFAADSLTAHFAGVDRVMGEEVRSGAIAKMASGVIRASGLRRHSAVLRASFGLEYQAAVANDLARPWAELSQGRRDAFARVGLSEDHWAVIQRAEPWTPRDDAPFLTANDIRETGHPDARAIADRYQRLLDTEMDYAIIESGDPITRAFLYGDSQPGTLAGETRRAIGLYKSFPITFVNLHFARAMARGWDGTRLGHAGLTFMAMSAMGVVAMQSKEIAKGRDPLSLDPTERTGQLAWGRAILQGGGLGVFGDILGEDKTRFGNSWAATMAGPQFAAVERVLGTTLLRNVTRAMKGEESHLSGDLLYTAGSFVPGSSLWFGRLAFQRGVMDQAALMIDERAPERFRRMEQEARKSWGQDFWWRPGEASPDRSPDLSRMTEPAR